MLQANYPDMYFKSFCCLFQHLRDIKSEDKICHFGNILPRSTNKTRENSIFIKSDKCVMLVINLKAYNNMLYELNRETRNKVKMFSALFPNLSTRQITKFISFFHEQEYNRNFHIYRKGQKTDSIYVIKEGVVEVRLMMKF